MTKFTRKSKIELHHMTNAESTLAVTITIDSNHTNNDLTGKKIWGFHDKNA